MFACIFLVCFVAFIYEFAFFFIILEKEMLFFTSFTELEDSLLLLFYVNIGS